MKVVGEKVPVRIKGVLYPSMGEAAKALGFSPSNISMHLNRHGHFDNLGKGHSRPGLLVANATPVAFGKLKFRSISLASRELGIPRKNIRTYMKGTCHHKTAEKILKAVREYLDKQKET